MSYQLMSSFDPRLASAKYQVEWRSASEIAGVISVKGDRRQIYTGVNFRCDENLIIISITEI